jgi:DNA replication protein DnaC
VTDWLVDEWGDYDSTANLFRGRDLMHHWTFASFPADDDAGRRARDAMVAWSRDGEPEPTPHRVYIYGPPSGGKSGLAFAAAREWDREVGQVVFENVRELLERQRARYGRGEPMALDHLLRTYDDTLVVLDDVGAGKQSEFAVETLALIVERLHAADRFVVATSNYRPSVLAKRLGRDDPIAGERVVARLLEDALVIELDRGDLRTRSTRRAA